MQLIRKLLRWFVPLRDWLYLLQLEEYELTRYVQHIPRRWGRSHFEKRGTLRFTLHIKLITVAWVVVFVLMGVLLWAVAPLAITLGVFTLPVLTPLLLVPATLLVRPVVRWQRWRIMRRLRKQMAHHTNVRVIAITGSYGKTTTKYALHELLRHTYATEIIPDNINTALGIAAYLQKNPSVLQAEYLIVEIGAYIPGDIAEVTDILQPVISVLTAVGDQHLERFGSIEALRGAKYEIFAHAPDAHWFTTTQVTKQFAALTEPPPNVTVVAGIGTPEDNLALAAAVARHCGVSEAFITDSLASLTPPTRRNLQQTINGVTVIDNSYNISPQTAASMLRAASAIAKEEQKQLVVMTAGIAEQGHHSKMVNESFGEMLSEFADRVIALPSIYIPDVRNGLRVPVSEVEVAKPIVLAPEKYVDGDKEALLMFPEHTDLSYLN
jgi:UDP-N-acetylmuramoyl-tripeptide--D-alanyl-D-alanine ligase